MKKLFATYCHSLLGGLIATFILAYPQARVVGAPDRGVMASSVTLGILFGILFAGVLAVATVFARIGIWATAKAFRLENETTREWLAFVWGCGAMAGALLLTPFGENPLDTTGFVAAWFVMAGFGAMAAEEPFITRASMKMMGSGTLVSVLAGGVALALTA